MNNYYIYIILDPRKPGNFLYGEYQFNYEPFYVGKGKNKRWEKHFYDCHIKKDKNRLKSNKINKIKLSGFNPKSFVIKLNENLTEIEALEFETKIISVIGRLNIKTGPLTNLTSGGDGVSGNINPNKGKNWEDIIGFEKATKYKKEMSNARKGANNPNYGRKMNTGKSVKQLDSDNNVIKIWASIREAAESLRIHYGTISACLTPKGKCKYAGGYKWEYCHRPNPKNLEKDKRFFTYEVTFPEGSKKIVTNLSQLARENGLASSFFPAIASGKRPSKIWGCKKI